MYQRKSKIQTLMILSVDCVCIFVSLILANYIRNKRLFESDNARMDFGMLLGSCLVVYLAMNLLRNINRNMFLRDPLHEMIGIIRNNLIMFGGAAVILYFFNLLDAYSRLVLFLFPVFNCVLMFVVHQLWKKMMPSLYQWVFEQRKILLVADEENAALLVETMKGMKDFSYDLTGIVPVAESGENKAGSAKVQETGNTQPWTTGEISGISVVADFEHLIEYCQMASLDEVIVVVENKRRKDMLPILETMAEMGITIHYEIPVPELVSASQKALSQFGSFYAVTYANRVAPIGQLILKRVMDLAGALVGCVMLLILTVFVAPLIRLESPGPVFFAQKRVGRNGRVFKMYKFRSMYADAEERKKELMAQNEMNGLMFKMENDPRITKVGRFLRKTSLDEFPQFLNILKGDMSLVGTRPPTLDEFKHYSPYHKKRLSFRPGLTGMWQVSGRSDITDFEEIVRLDVAYIDNWSFMLDVKILLKTMLAVFKESGAK